MLREPNCLVLDEPTNHLDIGSLEVLETELERFPGTVFFVSHDRYFLDRIADKIVEVRDGELHRYEGGLQRLEGEKVLSGWCVPSYLSRTMVTGPSLTRATSIIAPKLPVITEAMPASRSRSQK